MDLHTAMRFGFSIRVSDHNVPSLTPATYRFSHPTLTTPKNALPPPRRAHTTVLYLNFLVVFGGGNGQAALNDVWALDVSDCERLSWQEWTAKGPAPQKKGYHTANLVGAKMVVFGGSDGHASFSDVHVLNLREFQAYPKLIMNRNPHMDAPSHRIEVQSLVSHIHPSRVVPVHARWA